MKDDRGYGYHDGKLFLVIITGIILTFAVIIFIGVMFSRATCNQTIRVAGAQGEYNFPAGCLIKHGDNIVGIDMFKHFQEEEIRKSIRPAEYNREETLNVNSIGESKPVIIKRK